MTRIPNVLLWACVILCVLSLSLVARSAPEIPRITSYVTDQAGMMSPEGRARLEQQLVAYERQTGHQFALLSIPSLEEAAIEDYSIRVAEQWKLGDEQRDDGLIVVLAQAERKMRIEVGYGLEGAIPDAIAARVIRYKLTPAFKQGEFEAGIFAAFDALMKTAAGESVRIGPAPGQEQSASRGISVFALLFWGLIFFFSMRSRFGGALLAGMLLGGSGRRGGGFGGGGGGFGGGGGGGFGGGGASGGW